MRLLLLPLLFACAPTIEEVAPLAEARLGRSGRSVALRFIEPPASEQACCCTGDKPWFELASAPPTCDLFEGLEPGQAIYAGSSFVEIPCLVEHGLLEARAVQRRTVSCANVRCEGQEAPPAAGIQLGGFTPQPAEVHVATPALEALKEKPGSYYAGTDRYTEILETEWLGLNTARLTLAKREQFTELGQCVPEDKSRRPGPNRKVELKVEREGGAWR